MHRRRRYTIGRHPAGRYLLFLKIRDPRVDATIRCIGDRFTLHHAIQTVPHITLIGRFTLKKGTAEDVIHRAVEDAVRGIRYIPLHFSHWSQFRGRTGHAVVCEVRLGVRAADIHTRIAESLAAAGATLGRFDLAPFDRIFHVTVAMNLAGCNADRIVAALSDCPAEELAMPRDPAPSLRVSLLRNGALRAEYDLTSGRWIDRPRSFARAEWSDTLARYRQSAGIELVADRYTDPEDTLLIADLHLGHANIIRYCGRPFSDVAEMDRVLIANWNHTVRKDQEVIFLGDFAYGPDALPAADYCKNLNGTITWITGNHDAPGARALPFITVEKEGFRFLCIHDPDAAPPGYDGWVIHGHAHNNHLSEYPFLDRTRRRVNLSAELVGYSPVPLSGLITLIRQQGGGGHFDHLPLTPP